MLSLRYVPVCLALLLAPAAFSEMPRRGTWTDGTVTVWVTSVQQQNDRTNVRGSVRLGRLAREYEISETNEFYGYGQRGSDGVDIRFTNNYTTEGGLTYPPENDTLMLGMRIPDRGREFNRVLRRQ